MKPLAGVISAELFGIEGAAAGAIVSVLIPGKWVFYVAPDHPAYVDLFREQIRDWPADALRQFETPGMPAVTREHAKAELARRGRR